MCLVQPRVPLMEDVSAVYTTPHNYKRGKDVYCRACAPGNLQTKVQVLMSEMFSIANAYNENQAVGFSFMSPHNIFNSEGCRVD